MRLTTSSSLSQIVRPLRHWGPKFIVLLFLVYLFLTLSFLYENFYRPFTNPELLPSRTAFLRKEGIDETRLQAVMEKIKTKVSRPLDIPPDLPDPFF